MLSERQIEALLQVFQARMQGVTDEYLRLMGEHLRDIGQLTPSDINRLVEMRRMGTNMRRVKEMIAEAAGMNVSDLNKIFRAVAASNLHFAEAYFGAGVSDRLKGHNGIATPIERVIKAQLRVTGQEFSNLSQTSLISLPYRKAVDVAVNTVQSGITDYNTAIKRAITDAAEKGLRVRYPSGYSRRLDSAVRQNVLDGIRAVNQDILSQIGNEFGADGVEITAHQLCAEDHLPYQGRQFATKAFQDLQRTLRRPFGMWNCRHTMFPIILGISEPAYDESELEEYKRYSTEEIEIDGKKMSRYEWSQEMRRTETAIRWRKDQATIANAAGNDALVRKAEQEIAQLKDRYKDISAATDLKTDWKRTQSLGAGNKFKAAHAEKEKTKVPLAKTSASPSSAPAAAPAAATPIKSPEESSFERIGVEEWFPGAVPNKHKVIEDKIYTAPDGTEYVNRPGRKDLEQDHTQKERDMATLLNQVVGGDIHLIPRVNYPQGVKTADYRINGELVDLKTLKPPKPKEGKNRIYDRIKDSVLQANQFIIDVTDSGMTEAEIYAQIKKVFEDKHTQSVTHIVIVRDNKIVSVNRKKSK